MKKFIKPNIEVVRFDNKDIIATSTRLSVTEVTAGNIEASAPDRCSIWDE